MELHLNSYIFIDIPIDKFSFSMARLFNGGTGLVSLGRPFLQLPGCVLRAHHQPLVMRAQ